MHTRHTVQDWRRPLGSGRRVCACARSEQMKSKKTQKLTNFNHNGINYKRTRAGLPQFCPQAPAHVCMGG